MTTKQLAVAITKAEGLKVQVSIGNAREIVGIISDICWLDTLTCFELMRNGMQRARNGKSRVKRKKR